MALKIKYKDYTYISNNSEDNGEYDYNNPNHADIVKKYSFDKDKFTSMMNSGSYSDAVRYARNYHFTDPNINARYNAKLNQIEQDGLLDMQTNAYLKEKDIDMYHKKELLDNKYNLNAIKDTNPLAQQLIEYRKHFGEGYDDDGNLTEAQEYEFGFYPEKVHDRLIGRNWLGDILAPDNQNTAANFIANLGISEDELLSRGVTKNVDKNGVVSYRISKTNPLIDDFIAAIYDNPNANMFGLGTSFKSFDSNGKALKFTSNESKPMLSYTEVGHVFPNSQETWWDRGTIKEEGGTNRQVTSARKIAKLLHGAKKDLEDFSFDDDNRQLSMYSSVTEAIIDNDKSKPKSQIKQTLSGAINWHSDQYKIYWNENVESEKTDSNVSLNYTNDDKVIADLENLVSASDINNTTIALMMNEGKIGTLITVNASLPSKNILKRAMDIEDRTNTRNTTIWIEGFVPEELQQYLQEDTYTSSKAYTNALKSANHFYHTFENGDRVEYDRERQLFATYNNGEFLGYQSTEDIENRVNTERTINQIKPLLYSKHLNNNGEVVNQKELIDEIKRISVDVCKEMYGTEGLDDVDDIFKMIGSNGSIAPRYENDYNISELKKLNNIFYIYHNLLNVLNWYK